MVDNPFSKDKFSDLLANVKKSVDDANKVEDSPEPIIIPPPEPYKPNKAHIKVAAILAEYNNIESDIPVGHEYWRLKREI